MKTYRVQSREIIGTGTAAYRKPFVRYSKWKTESSEATANEAYEHCEKLKRLRGLTEFRIVYGTRVIA